MFKNETKDEQGNPTKRPPMSSSNCEVLEDLRKGDRVDIAGWLNRDDKGEQSLSVTITKKIPMESAPSQGDQNNPPWG